MTLKLLDVRIGQVGVEASRAAIDGEASGSFGRVGSALDYEQFFDEARLGTSAATLPWRIEKPFANRFWKKYVTADLAASEESEWPAIARRAVVPLKVPASIPGVRLDPGLKRAYSEAYVWPTGVGIVWNNWIRRELEIQELVDLIGEIHTGSVELDDGRKVRTKKYYNDTLEAVRNELWGEQKQQQRREAVTVVSIIRASADQPQWQDVESGLEALLDGIEGAWGHRPKIPADDRHLDSGHSVYVAPRLRLVWLPRSFLSERRTHSGGCFHHNLLASTLQAEMLGAAIEMFAADKKKHGALPGQYQSSVEHVLERIGFFLSDTGYSAPFLTAQLERSQVAQARAAFA